jgi:hypothetical protein
MLKRIILAVLALILLAPLFMWLTWFFTPNTILIAAIVDKTVLTNEVQKHKSLTWVLNHENYTKTPTKSYRPDKDYFGFFPLKESKFKIKGLERFSSDQLKQLSLDADLVYFTDTYGIYNNEWYSGKGVKEQTGMLYGGLSEKDIQLLELMKARKKLIIAEFNTIGSPTDSLNRDRFENSFGIRWTGWTGRFFDNLDTTVNKEIPQWLINSYKKTHQNQWPFKKSGIAFVSNTGQVNILEEGKHLIDPMPVIVSNSYGQRNLALPTRINYTTWFDIIKIDPKVNQFAATFNINSTKLGLEELQKSGIPTSFPAITYHKGSDYTFYYFSGDFCDSPAPMAASYFRGISLFESMFYDKNDQMERSSFFWNFYKPMLTNILEDHSNRDGN